MPFFFDCEEFEGATLDLASVKVVTITGSGGTGKAYIGPPPITGFIDAFLDLVLLLFEFFTFSSFFSFHLGSYHSLALLLELALTDCAFDFLVEAVDLLLHPFMLPLNSL